MTYYRLLDVENKGKIVRANGAEQYLWADGEWERSGIMLDYFSDESPFYDLYETISESEALGIVAKQS